MLDTPGGAVARAGASRRDRSDNPSRPTTGAQPGAQDGAYVRACALCGFAEIVKSNGGDPVEMLERAGIDPVVLTEPEMLVPFARKGALLEIAARELGNHSLGLEWALSVPPHFPNTGPMLVLRESVATFGGWMRRSAVYWRLETSGIALRVVADSLSETATFHVGPGRAQPIQKQQSEFLLGNFVRLARAVLEDDAIDPICVRFAHPAPRDTSLHDRIFRCPVRFDAGANEISFARNILVRRLRRHPTALEDVMSQFLRYRIGLLPRYDPSVSTSTRLAIRTVLGAGICTKDFIARSLRANPRKLQRLLAEEGTSYDEIFDTVRRQMADRLLTGTAASISTIAGMLEFSSAAAMTAAVKRWTGMTPRAYRARRQAA